MKGFIMMYNFKKFSAVLLCGILLCGCGQSEPADDVVFLPADTTAPTESAADTTLTTQTLETTKAEPQETDASTAETTLSAETETTASAVSETTTTSAQSTDASTTTTATTTTTTQTEPQPVQGQWYDSLRLGTNCADYIAANPNHTMQEAPSCLGSGSDRVYDFGQYTLYTYFDGNLDILAEILISQPGIPTREGAQVGMSRAEISAIYGSDSDTVETADGTLEITYSGDTVSSLSVYVIL